MRRRKLYPKVKKMGGLYSVARQPVDDPLLDEIKERMKKMPLVRATSDSEVMSMGSPIN
jgi:hypothetical protein